MAHIVTLLALALASTAQSGTDFSGRWLLNSPAPAPDDAARVIVVEQPVTQTNGRGEPMPPAYLQITMHRELASGTTTEMRQIGVTGGVVGGVVAATGERIRTPSTYFETRWLDRALILVNRVDGPDGPHTGEWSERQETWSLDPDGRLRVEVVAEAHDRPRQTSVCLYRREQARAGSKDPAYDRTRTPNPEPRT